MTPPDSPDKPKGSGRRQGQLDLHPTLDARSPNLLPGFDVRRGTVLRSDVFLSPAVTQHPIRMVRINLGPFVVDVTNAGGAIPTVQDVVCALMKLNSVPATPQEVAAAVQMCFTSPGLPRHGVSRGTLLDLKPFFGGCMLRAIHQGTAIVDCHLRARP